MKRELSRTEGFSFTDPKRNFSDKQLVGIGAVAMIYNVAEEMVDDMAAIGWRFPFDAEQILSRINGIDGKIELIKYAAKECLMPEKMLESLSASLGEEGFSGLKKYRDAVIHARMLDIPSGTGMVIQRRAKRYEVMMSEGALEGLYSRLLNLAYELDHLGWAYYALTLVSFNEDDDQLDYRPEDEFERRFTRYEEYRNKRLSLSPLPDWPK